MRGVVVKRIRKQVAADVKLAKKPFRPAYRQEKAAYKAEASHG